MSKAFKALLIFAAMVALPIVLDGSRHSRAYIHAPGAAWGLAALIILAALAAAVFLARIYTVYETIGELTGWLSLAEREFNHIINSGYDQTGRKDKVKERREWAEAGAPPAIQVFNAGYRTVAHEVFDANTADMKGRGKTMGKAGMTAFLLRELYEGHVGAAQSKVWAEIKSGEDPYIAPGIWELIGYDRFDKENNKERGFPQGSGANGYYLKAAADIGGFPKDIAIVKTVNGSKAVVKGLDALNELTRQERPIDPEETSPWSRWSFEPYTGAPSAPPLKPPGDAKSKRARSKFWRIAKAIMDDWLD